MWDICRICPVLKNFGVWLSLVEYLNGVQVAAGSNPVTPTTSERTMLRSDFSFTKKNQSRAPSFLLFRKKARLLRLCLCKRRHNASAALPLFCDASLASLLLLSNRNPLSLGFRFVAFGVAATVAANFSRYLRLSRKFDFYLIE